MIMMIELMILIALGAAFVVLLIKKWGIAEWMQVHGNGFFSKLFSCDLCMSFWAAVMLSVIIAMETGDVTMLVTPVFSTPITRMLV